MIKNRSGMCQSIGSVVSMWLHVNSVLPGVFKLKNSTNIKQSQNVQTLAGSGHIESLHRRAGFKGVLHFA